MPNMFKAACVQINAGTDITENMDVLEELIREAAGQGASLIATPEMSDSIRRYARDKVADAKEEAQHEGVKRYAALAKDLGVTLLAGSFGVKIENDKLANRSLLFAPDGKIIGRYDKIHMFDVKLSRTEFYNESKEYQAGTKAVIATAPDYKIGMGVCYDLRFPHLWRDLAKNGAQILTAPAAFTVPTGKAHWEVLLRARAIETGSFVIAAAQCGTHEGDRKTYGHSMIINPWGEILGENPTELVS